MGVEFTIIIPVYNDPGRVGRAIRSVLEQTMPDFELIVLDDCSTEQIAEVVNTFQDERLRLIRNDRNLGCGANKNKGLWLASAPLFKPLDSDDWLEPACLEKMLETFQRNPAVALVTVAATEHQETIPQKTRPRKNPGPNNRYGLCSGRSFQELYFQGKSAGNPSQVAVRTEWAKDAGGWDARLVNGDEGALWLRIVQDRNAFFLPENLAHITLHSASLTAIASRTGLEAIHVAQMFKDVLRDLPELNTAKNRFWLVWTRGYNWFFRGVKLFAKWQWKDAFRCWSQIGSFAPSLWWVPIFFARACYRRLSKVFSLPGHCVCEHGRKAAL